MMTNVLKRSSIIVAFTTALFIVLGVSLSVARAEEVMTESTTVAPTSESVEASADAAMTKEPVAETTSEENYNFIAQPGDSYTKMARKAVQIFGFDTATELSGAQIVYLETNLTILAGSPELEVGQAVSVSKADITQWAEKAKALTAPQLALWQVYADTVDFNTDKVGEAR